MPSAAAQAAQWNELGKLFYRKRDLYRMLWQGVNIETSLVASAKYGGPIALVRDDKKLSKVGVSQVKP
eukprot:2618078-Pyramimonas_sp.AAC.1